MGRPGIIVVDIGNTNIVFGVCEGDKILTHWRISTDFKKTPDEYGIMLLQLMLHRGIDPSNLKDSAISSVVPPLTPTFQEALREYFRIDALVVGPGVRTGVEVKYDNPREVGADRIVNAAAAYVKYGGPAVVVDFGTATTFDAISAKGEYLGGAIAPGIRVSTEALVGKAAKLERIEIARPKSVIGKNTVASMQAGIVFGFAGQVDEIVRRMKADLGENTFVVATGGLAELIASETTTINKVDPLLTLDGLRIILERNRSAAR